MNDLITPSTAVSIEEPGCLLIQLNRNREPSFDTAFLQTQAAFYHAWCQQQRPAISTIARKGAIPRATLQRIIHDSRRDPTLSSVIKGAYSLGIEEVTYRLIG